MIVHISRIAPGRKKAAGRDARLAPSLRVRLDWIQYKTDFHDPVIVRRTGDSSGRALALAEIAVDLRQGFEAALPAGSSDANHPDAVAL